MINEATRLERIEKLIEQYVNNFGKARIAIYFFPDLENHGDFPRFLNAFLSALRRANSRPAYSWTYDSCRKIHSLFLIVSGYFRNDMQDINDAARRIWQLYSPSPVQFIAETPVDGSTLVQDKMKIMEIINSTQFSCSIPQRILPFHQRTFACSKLY